MKKLVWPIVIIGTAFGFLAIMWWLVAGTKPDVIYPSGQVGDHQQSLLMLTVLLSAAVVIPVFLMLGIFAWRYRDTNKKAKYKPEWQENVLLEAIWWGIPVIIITSLAIVTWFSSHSLDPHKAIVADKPPLKVQVVALQWKWLFIYPEEGIATVNSLPLEVDRPVSFEVAADAPMSAFWIPSLGSQIYAMNGMSTKLNLIPNKTGIFYGYNTNINGEGYSDMKFPVEVMSGDAFKKLSKKIASSSMTLDYNHYEEIAKPSRDEPVHQMSLSDKGLYDKILMKYMDHGGHEAPASEDNSNHEGMEH